MSRAPGRAMQRALLALAALAALAGGLGAAPRAHAQPEAPEAVRAVRVDEHPGAQVPLSLAFTDSAGEEVHLSDYLGDGQPALLLLTYNRCAMLCSLVLRGAGEGVAELARAGDVRPGRDYRLLNVSIDPRDNAHEAARQQAVMLERIGAAGRPEAWPFLVGEQPAIAALAERLGFGYAWDERTQQYAHAAVIFVLDGRGRVSEYLYGFEFAPADLAAALARARAGADARVGRARAQDDDNDDGVAATLLACFRFDSSVRVFGAPVQRLFQAGALLVLVLLGVSIGVFVRRERQRERERAEAVR
ncbi:SCO family protein [Haliangium ochraceum]|uniref:Electron transport protein SCO1/SenC n=1 Tax=Haliangium ochraceum (strain DSM 14365 / JCM 11303 / SMP-2) TaxID=502025 RepID=D0LN59_HALO1|nr:SCO family protein [Haliangium ochraceum]ACY15236.1 conserved hypothetical protein [Haliangium ochraceum DSM 14365]